MNLVQRWLNEIIYSVFFYLFIPVLQNEDIDTKDELSKFSKNWVGKLDLKQIFGIPYSP